VPCYALPFPEQQRTVFKFQQMPSEPLLIENGARLQSYAKESETITLNADIGEWPGFCNQGEMHLSLPQLRDWLRTQGVALRWSHLSC
jgi:hypothetical protein